MFKKILYLTVLLLVTIAGCVSVPKPRVVQPPGVYHIVQKGETLYRISKIYGVDLQELMRRNNIKDPTQLEVGVKLLIPGATSIQEVGPYRPESLESIEKIVGEKQNRIHWQTITLHHSATVEGNAESFDRTHRHRGMGGLFYHFVIGNGAGSGDGEIEVGWRWKQQVEVNRKRDIQICLVGNFDKQEMTAQQFNSLVNLLKVLTRQYSIPVSSIRRHKDVLHCKATECPGTNFPLSQITAELKK